LRQQADIALLSQNNNDRLWKNQKRVGEKDDDGVTGTRKTAHAERAAHPFRVLFFEDKIR
jgi:predicted oxidoreductase (fatty acid repression mutant protein)